MVFSRVCWFEIFFNVQDIMDIFNITIQSLYSYFTYFSMACYSIVLKIDFI